MRIEYVLTANNSTFQNGDTLLVSFPYPFLEIQSIEGFEFEFLPINSVANGHDIYVRWSYDTDQLDRAIGKPHITWSSWVEYAINENLNPNIDSIFQSIIRKDSSFDLQFKIVRRGNDLIERTISKIYINVTPQPSGRVVNNTNPDLCVANSCATYNFSSGVSIACDKSLLFKPYDLLPSGVQLYRDLSCAVSDIFGHCVRYFKTRPKLESADVVLREYSLFDVTDVKDIKLLVPDNQFPDNQIMFTSFDMDFDSGFEVHIVKDHFERAFGHNLQPEQKDYLYFPLLDRIYEVNSAYLFKDFLMGEYYYKVMLFKWQDKDNVIRDGQIAEYVDSIAENFQEVLQEEINREFDEIVKSQYQVISVGGFDHVRSSINENLIIENQDMSNYFTVVAKYFYALNRNLGQNEIAVTYKLAVNRTITDNTAFSFWFKTQKTSTVTQTNTYDILVDGYNASESKGYRVKLMYSAGTTAGSAVTSVLRLQINAQTKDFTIPALTPDKWYGCVINHLNTYSQASVYLWEMKYNPSVPTQNRTSDLRLICYEVMDITSEAVQPTSTYFQLVGGTLTMTNIRVWSQGIEEEKQPLLLNQYVVRDSDWALLIDNAVAPLRNARTFIR